MPTRWDDCSLALLGGGLGASPGLYLLMEQLSITLKGLDLHLPPLAPTAILLWPCSLFMLVSSLFCFPFVLLLLSYLCYPCLSLHLVPATHSLDYIWFTSNLQTPPQQQFHFTVWNITKNIPSHWTSKKLITLFPCRSCSLSLIMFIRILGLKKIHSSAHVLCDNKHYFFIQFLSQ